MRKPFQGVSNIIRFNWPFYLLSAGAVLGLIFIREISNASVRIIADALLFISVGSTLISLLVSFYVYDLSGLYELRWLDDLPHEKADTIANINAGFDETSSLLAERYKDAELVVFDFYDPARHTEASIRRARKSYPPFPGTRRVATGTLPIKSGSIANAFAIMSSHEIRNAVERRSFFSEINRALRPNGRIVVVEHLRDAANFLAYNIGAFHFHSRAAWLDTFDGAALTVAVEKKITPFLTVFFLTKNGPKS